MIFAWYIKSEMSSTGERLDAAEAWKWGFLLTPPGFSTFHFSPTTRERTFSTG